MPGGNTYTRRLVVAFELPTHVRQRLTGLAEALVDDVPDARSVPAEHLHSTICVLGACDEERLPGLAASLFDAVRDHDILTTGLGAPVGRPRTSAARLCAIPLTDPTGEMARVCMRIGAELADVCTRSPDERPPWPHVTIARFSRPTRMRRFLHYEGEHVFAIDRITLYDSYITPGRAPFSHRMLTVPLGSHGERELHHG